MTESQELEAPRADIAGKEPVLSRDWDQESLILAIRAHQLDIIDAELAYLLKNPYWQRPRDEEFEHTFKKVPADIAAKTLDACRLDNIPVQQTVVVPWGGQSAYHPSLEEQIETRFDEAVEHVRHPVGTQWPTLTRLFE